jgi:hypothetical protein
LTLGRHATKRRSSGDIESQYPVPEALGFKPMDMAFQSNPTPTGRKALGAKVQFREHRHA